MTFQKLSKYFFLSVYYVSREIKFSEELEYFHPYSLYLEGH